MGQVRTRDRKLYEQARAAASSIVLHLAEGSRRTGRDRKHLWSMASGSAQELRVALRVAVAWGDVDVSSVDPTLRLIDRVQTMLWRLVHARR